MASLYMLSIFLILTCSKVPICAAMGFGVIVGLLQMNLPIATIPRYMLAEVRSIPLLAIPFFILAANVLEEMNIIRRIFDFINHLISRIPGGLAQVTIVTEMILSGITGAALSDIAGLGYITIKAMDRAGYRRDFAAGLVGAASILGPIIPPSIMFIVYAVLMDVSIAKLFIAGLMPGLAIGGLLMLTVFIFAKTGYEKCPATRRSTIREIARSGFLGAPALVTPVIILYGMTGGFITPTEAGVIAVVYSLLLSFLYREFTFDRLYKAFAKSIRITALIMYLTGIGCAMGFVLTSEQVAEKFTIQMLSLTSEPWLIFMMINLILLVLGCLLETLPAMLISIPVLGPMAVKLGMDPLQFGVVLTLNLSIGILTPPVGLGLYTLCAMTGMKLETSIRETAVFLPTLAVCLVLITYIPAFSLWLPNLLFSK
jgi:tripartite ATP-independent transporter DctM subunit